MNDVGERIAYRGSIGRCGHSVAVITDRYPDGFKLPLRLDLANHSPTGFAWGYAGSGPSQLALAILADALGDDARAIALYQHFKQRVIAGLDMEKSWELPLERVLAEVAAIEAELADA